MCNIDESSTHVLHVYNVCITHVPATHVIHMYFYICDTLKIPQLKVITSIVWQNLNIYIFKFIYCLIKSRHNTGIISNLFNNR